MQTQNKGVFFWMRNISDWQAKSENTTANLSFSILLNCLNEPVCIIIKWLFGIPNKGQQSNNPQKILKHEAKADIEFRSSIYYSMLLNTEIRFHFNGLRLSNRVNWERMNHLHELIYLCIYILSLIYAPHCRKLHDMNSLLRKSYNSKMASDCSYEQMNRCRNICPNCSQ